jgi:hypothetical protein
MTILDYGIIAPEGQATMNSVAPEGQVFVCAACGKRSRDLYGDQRIDQGWDVSCTCNAILVYEEKKINKDGILCYVAVGDVANGRSDQKPCCQDDGSIGTISTTRAKSQTALQAVWCCQ